MCFMCLFLNSTFYLQVVKASALSLFYVAYLNISALVIKVKRNVLLLVKSSFSEK